MTTTIKSNAEKVLKNEIDSRGLKIKYVADAIGITPNYLGQVLNNSRNLSVDVAIRASRFLNIPLKKILN